MADGATIVVEGGVITEIRTSEEEAAEVTEDERGEENDNGDSETEEEFSEKDAEIDRLKSVIAEKDAEIDELKRKLEEAEANAKSEDDAAVLNMVSNAGGMEWLKGVQSNGKIDKRETSTKSIENLEKKIAKKTFADYMNEKRNKKKITNKKD